MIDHHTKERRRWLAEMQRNMNRYADYRVRFGYYDGSIINKRRAEHLARMAQRGNAK